MFLIEYLKNINLCKLQISILEENKNLSYAEDLTLFRIKKIVDEEFFSLDNDSTNTNLVEILEFEKLTKLCIINLNYFSHI